MKKILLCFVIAAAFMGISCKSAPAANSGNSAANSGNQAAVGAAAAGPTIEGDVTQAKVNDALGQIYDSHRNKLDMSGAKDYTVASGDTLSQITRKFYGSLTDVRTAGVNNGFYFPVIMMASNTKIVDPDLIQPGMQLKIPDLKKNLAKADARQSIKDTLVQVAYVYNKKGKAAEETGLKTLANSL